MRDNVSIFIDIAGIVIGSITGIGMAATSVDWRFFMWPFIASIWAAASLFGDLANKDRRDNAK